MSLFKDLWRLYALLRYQLRGILPPRRKAFRSCGEGVHVHHQVRFFNCQEIILEDELYIGPRCNLFGHGGLHICRGTVLGENVTLIASNHRFEGPELSRIPFDDASGKTGIVIGTGVWIGQNAIVLPGVTLGAHSVIAAGSVVTRDTEAFGLYAGVPARLQRLRRMPENIDPGTLPTWVTTRSNRFHLY
jgi:acetyltransferase-like isoleucine patch superfamily enzyme